MELLITLFLCGDVMTGRGIDQALPRSVDPQLDESYVKHAGMYVQLAEKASGRINTPVGYEHVWGDALDELSEVEPAVRIINLETAVTTSDDAWPGKGIHYRMHPDNVPLITIAGVDCCVLANNHVLDWGYDGLSETIGSLESAGVATVGAGSDRSRAGVPWVHEGLDSGRVVVFAFARPTSGVPSVWAATDNRAGVSFLEDLSDQTVAAVVEHIRSHSDQDDVVVASIHWGGNWGYDIPVEQVDFAHRLIEDAGVDIVHGHSSHHVKAIDVHRDRLILYGCGDFINDYEGIGGHERFRPDLSLMYFPRVTPDGALRDLRLTPMRMKRFGLHRVERRDAAWLRDTLNRESERFGVRFELVEGQTLRAVLADD